MNVTFTFQCYSSSQYCNELKKKSLSVNVECVSKWDL